MNNKIIRISKEFRWEMAHALWNYDGLCKHIHGHSYVLVVTIKGEINNEVTSSKNGMVYDFGDLKKIVNENIVNVYDHSLVINKASNIEGIDMNNQAFQRLHRLPFQPTAENLILMFANIIKSKLPGKIVLNSLRLYETANSFAEWFYNDTL